jgi:predicted metal-dependent hydrolase
MQQITIGNTTIDVIRKDIKNLHLAVYPPNGRVRIAAPLSFDDEAVRLFAVSKLTWVKKQQTKYRDQERQTEREYVSGENHYFKGRRYILRVKQARTRQEVVIRNKTYIELYMRESSTKEERERVMTEWYRKQLKMQIPALMEKWEKITGVEVKTWGVKQMKTKWGSCNIGAGRVWINLELAKKPVHSLEYIILHEMLHIKERNHNERFIGYMDRYMPRWRIYKKELNRIILSHAEWSY